MAPAQTARDLLAELQRHLNSADFAPAAAACRKLLRLTPDDPRLHHNLAHCLTHTGDIASAERHASRAVGLDPSNAQFRQGLCSILVQANAYDRAVAECEEGLRIHDDPALAGYLAELLIFGHRYEEAEALLRPRMAEKPVPLVVLAFARLAPRIDARAAAIDALQALIDEEPVTSPYRPRALFRLGKLFDSARRYDEAFEAFRQANAIRPPSYSAGATTEAFRRVRAAWSRQTLSRLVPPGGADSDRPVFIVSVPRSGSTLVEQILAAHSRIAGMGEWQGIPQAAARIARRQGARAGGLDPSRLTPAVVREEARAYLRSLEPAGDARRVTDKMLTNFQHLGLIACLFPNARIIECVRHPFDACLSCYFQDFTAGNPWARDLRSMAMFVRDFQSMMDHWRSVIANPILTVRYEDLVDGQESETRRLIEFLDLPWEEDCLRFFESRRVAVTASNQQVRQPMYRSSVRRYRNYDSHLAPLREILGDPEAL